MIVGAVAAVAGMVGMGALGAALARDYIQTANKAIVVDAARSASRGLTGGLTARSVMSDAAGSAGGASLGYDYLEAEKLFQTAAGAGLDGAGTKTLARRVMQFERLGIGGGSAASFGSMFREGGGATGDFDAKLGLVFQEAMLSGVQLSKLPEYMQMVAASTTALAKDGIDVDPAVIVKAAAMIRGIGGPMPGFSGDRSLGIASKFTDIGRTVRGGGGTGLQQQIMLEAAGLGTLDEDGQMIDLLEALARLAEGNIDHAHILKRFGAMGGRSKRQQRGAALLMSDQGFASERQALTLVRRAGFAEQMKSAGYVLPPNVHSMGPHDEEAQGTIDNFIREIRAKNPGMTLEEAYAAMGSLDISGRARAATSWTQRSTAAISRRDVNAGMASMAGYLKMKRNVQALRTGATAKIVAPVMDSVGSAVQSVGNFVGGDGSIIDKIVDWVQGQKGVPGKGRKPGKTKSKPNPAKGGGYIPTMRIEPGPGMRKLLRITVDGVPV